MAGGTPRSGGSLFKGPQDLLCGLMFMGIGVLGIVIGWDYPRGTPNRLGTGVFPALLCWGLVGIGAIVFIEGLVTHGKAIGRIAWRPVVLISIAATLFALLIEPGGLIVAMVAMMIPAAFAGDDHTVREFSAFMVIMVVMALVIFIWGLEMPLKVFPWS